MSSDSSIIQVHHVSPQSSCAGKDFCPVPPSPELLALIQAQAESLTSSDGVQADRTDAPEGAAQHPEHAVGRVHTHTKHVGMDDGRVSGEGNIGDFEKIERPPGQGLSGTLNTIVLLVDFPDKPHQPQSATAHYERLLFDGANTDSMRRYYQAVSGYSTTAPQPSGGIDIAGSVHGWYTMPHNSTYYAGTKYGTQAYPRNAQRLTEDALQAAKKAGVQFPANLDSYGEGLVTALIIVHAGQGAEITGLKTDIWSHKHVITPTDVGHGLKVRTYLTVPEDCTVGVCAHEWGHLAARWADYYDTDPIESGLKSSGLGDYCLMASGSYGNRGSNPVYPNCMVRMFHNWVKVEEVSKSTSVKLKAVSEGGQVLRIRHSSMTAKQYIMVEYRRKVNRDFYLPDEGIAIYVIDESIMNVDNEDALAIELMQADGKRELASRQRPNRGDIGDLYPNGAVDTIGKSTNPGLYFPGHKWSGVSIKVKGRKGADEMEVVITLD